MSSRVLRKLQGENSLISNVLDENSDPEPDTVSSGGTRKKQLNVNRYDLLNHTSHSESEVKEDDDNETETAVGNVNGSENSKEITRRKKKKKKKKLVKTSSNLKSDDTNPEDEVERSVQEVNKILGETLSVKPSVPSEERSSSSRKGILSIEHRNLNPNNELKRIFGSKIIQSEQNKRRARGRNHVRSTWLVPARENWLQVGKQGVSMRSVEFKDGMHYFTYEHNAAYQQIQKKFLDAVESLNPDNIVAIINHHPYHIDALIQLSDMCKMSEDLQMAAELNERVLYCLECSFHPSFNLAQGNCRLDYRRQENRGLFISLFKHLTFVGQRACYRTALEFCKLLLSLDPNEDPMAVILCIDFYALKACEYAWLVRAGEEWASSKNLLQLPNFAFSLPIAHFYLGNMEVADQMLQDALIMFPGVLQSLLDKCGVQTDPRLAAHSYFITRPAAKDRPALRQLAQLYVHRCYHVWKDSDLLPWLERNVHRVLDRVDASDPYVAECDEKRAKRYHATPRPILRHIILTDMKEVTATLTEDTDGPVLSFDPLPPLDAVNLYVRPTRLRLHDHSNAFSIFFRSILPNFNINELATPADPQLELGELGGGEGEGAVGPAVDLRRSVRTLLDAMTDLLSNIHPPEVPNDGDADDDSDGVDDLP